MVAIPFGTVLTAMITPFDDEWRIDFDRTARLADHLVANGSDGLVVTGTTGESPTLSDDEKLALYRTVLDAVGGRAHVIAGTGSYDTNHSIELAIKAAELGVHGHMAVTPYYSRPSQGGLEAHFVAIAEAVDLPLIIYNIPGRSARLIELDTLASIARHANVVAIKDAVDDPAYTARSRRLLPDDVAIYSGSDIYTLSQLAVGAVGVISVASHFVGPQIKRMIEAHSRGDVVEARRLLNGLIPMFDACFAEPNPMPTKAGLNALWEYVGPPRLPLVPATGDTAQMIKDALGIAQQL
jgi:4-hydroxy-tetrahydrodipicolinate synthase